MPMAWSVAAKKDSEIRLYRHGRGIPFSGKSAAQRHDKCAGPTDLFTYLLRNAKLAVAGEGLRLCTDAEIVERKRAEDEEQHEQERQERAHDRGMLF